MKTQSCYVFVYGTLKRGQGNNLFLKDAQFLFEDIMLGRLFDLGAFPAMIFGKGHVYGEVWKISPKILAQLDRLEGTPHFFFRSRQEVIKHHWKFGDSVLGQFPWVYRMTPEKLSQICAKAKYIPSGFWERNYKEDAQRLTTYAN